MSESLNREIKELDVYTAETIAYATKPHMDKAVFLRELASKISLTTYRDIQHAKAKWHAERAEKESEEAFEAMMEGDTKKVDKLSDVGRECYEPERDELPEAAQTPQE